MCMSSMHLPPRRRRCTHGATSGRDRGQRRGPTLRPACGARGAACLCGRWRVIAFAGSATSAPGTGRGRRRRRALRRASGRCARPWAFGLSPCVRVGVRARRSPLAAGRRAGRERARACPARSHPLGVPTHRAPALFARFRSLHVLHCSACSVRVSVLASFGFASGAVLVGVGCDYPCTVVVERASKFVKLR